MYDECREQGIDAAVASRKKEAVVAGQTERRCLRSVALLWADTISISERATFFRWTDDEGAEHPDLDAAHAEGLNALVDAIQDSVLQGLPGQRLAVEVRDGLGPVLEIIQYLEAAMSTGKRASSQNCLSAQRRRPRRAAKPEAALCRVSVVFLMAGFHILCPQALHHFLDLERPVAVTRLRHIAKL